MVTYRVDGLAIELECSALFLQAPRSARDARCNGCGPGGWKIDLVPDDILGANVGAPDGPCCIHDWDYGDGDSEAERKAADARFHRNLQRVVRAYGGPAHLRWARLCAAWWYWRAVLRAGRAAFDRAQKF